MANSNGAVPTFGAGPTDSAGVTSSGTLAPTGTTGATTVTTPTPQGPGAAGLDPGGVTTTNVQSPGATGNNAVDQYQKIASQVMVGGNQAGAVAATPAKPYDEKQLVQSLADELGVKAQRGKSLEVAVVNALDTKYGVKIERSTTGTGEDQGGAGSLRHNIAGWFDDANAAVTSAASITEKALVPGSADKAIQGDEQQNVAQSDEQKYQAALKIKSIPLREAAIKAASKQTPLAQLKQMYSQRQQQDQPDVTGGQPDESTKALNDMLGKVAQKLGVSQAGPNALQDIAQATGAKYQVPGTSGSPGSPQTYAQNYTAFTKAWNANQKLADGQSFQQQWTENLENAGLLNADTNNQATAQEQITAPGSKKGTTVTETVPTAESAPSSSQVAQAYQTMLVNAQSANQSPSAYLAAAAQNPATNSALANGAPSEMYAFVQGVASEFGVGLSPEQINQISNFYGASATTADDPTSVEDQIKDAVVSLYNPDNPANPPGLATTMFTDIQAQALAYQIPINSQQLGSMVTKAMQGATIESMYVAADAAESAATETFQQQAAGLYPTLAPQIKAGNTVQNLVAPYFNVAESYTGVPSSTMMADQQSGGPSKWSSFLQGGTDPSTGAPAMQTLDQWKKTLMTDPKYGFQKTQGAQDMAEQMSSAILNAFGRVDTNGGSSTPFNNFNPSSALQANTT